MIELVDSILTIWVVGIVFASFSLTQLVKEFAYYTHGFKSYKSRRLFNSVLGIAVSFLMSAWVYCVRLEHEFWLEISTALGLLSPPMYMLFVRMLPEKYQPVFKPHKRIMK